jgi:hypothetical protein
MPCATNLQVNCEFHGEESGKAKSQQRRVFYTADRSNLIHPSLCTCGLIERSTWRCMHSKPSIPSEDNCRIHPDSGITCRLKRQPTPNSGMTSTALAYPSVTGVDKA